MQIGTVRQVERPTDAADRLADPLLVLDEREADVALATRPEALARADRDLRLARELHGELERGRGTVRLRKPRPDEHRPLRPLDLPADPGEPVAERVAPVAIGRVDLVRV